jgi:hypothetical protein
VQCDGILDWFRGETPKQRDKQARALVHPVRSAARLGLMWGALMWLLFFRTTNSAAVIGLAVGSALFGAGTVVWMQRRRRRDLNAPTP